MGSSPGTTAALQPPPGQTSNFVDPESIQPAIIAGLTVCLGVSTLSAVARCAAQWTLFKRLVWADAWMLLGWASQVAFVGFLYACLPYGAGRHQWDVTKSDYARIQFLLFIDFVLYDIAILGPKISILLQLNAIFAPRGRGSGTTAQRFYWAAMFLMAVNIIFYIALSFALIFQCTPVAKGWDPALQGSCLKQDALLESSGPFNIISDFLIFLLPISAVWQLQMPVRTRIGVASAFAVGLFGCVCSAVRLYYSDQLDTSGDATLLIFQNQLWANAEIAVAILIANIIILPRFVRHIRGVGSSYDQYYGASGNNNYGASRRSYAGQNASKHASRLPARDSFIKLTDTASKTQSNEDMALPIENPKEEGSSRSSEGIMRTVQIDTTEERIDDPAKVSVNGHRLDSDLTGVGARMYDYN